MPRPNGVICAGTPSRRAGRDHPRAAGPAGRRRWPGTRPPARAARAGSLVPTSSTDLGSRPARRTASPPLRFAVPDQRRRPDPLAGEVELTPGGRLPGECQRSGSPARSVSAGSGSADAGRGPSGLRSWPASTAIEAMMPVSLSPTSSHARKIPMISNATSRLLTSPAAPLLCGIQDENDAACELQCECRQEDGDQSELPRHVALRRHRHQPPRSRARPTIRRGFRLPGEPACRLVPGWPPGRERGGRAGHHKLTRQADFADGWPVHLSNLVAWPWHARRIRPSVVRGRCRGISVASAHPARCLTERRRFRRGNGERYRCAGLRSSGWRWRASCWVMYGYMVFSPGLGCSVFERVVLWRQSGHLVPRRSWLGLFLAGPPGLRPVVGRRAGGGRCGRWAC